MHAQDWNRIADLLMQIKKKIENLNPTRIPTITTQSEIHYHILSALEKCDKLAELDGMGWL